MESNVQSENEDSYRKKRPGRKPIDKHRIDLTDPKLKRKEQNRAAQRAFRERKEKFIAEMQEQIAQLHREKREREAELLSENDKLKAQVESLKQENQLLKNAYNSRFDLNRIPPQPTLDIKHEMTPQPCRRLPSLFGNEVDLYSAENPAPFSSDTSAKTEVQEEGVDPNNVLRCAPENEQSCKSKVLSVLGRAKGAGRRVYQVHQELKSYCPEFDLDAFCEGVKVNLDSNHILTDEDVDIYIDYIKQT